jgi:hypothetical protein
MFLVAKKNLTKLKKKRGNVTGQAIENNNVFNGFKVLSDIFSSNPLKRKKTIPLITK